MSVNDPRTRLLHMQQAGQKLIVMIENEDKNSFKKDEKLQLAVIRLIEIIGEAASRIDDSFRKKYPEIPWRPIVAMRNRLIHAYFAVDLDIVWQTAIKAIPELMEQIDSILDEINTDQTGNDDTDNTQ